MSKKNTITAVIITQNEEVMLQTCLDTISWCDQILVIDDGSTDKTVKIAENFGAKVISIKNKSFDQLRNEGLRHCQTNWVFYIDADERVTPTLAKEILVNIETNQASALSMQRDNICYGKKFKHGGWEQDQVTRIFKTADLEKWVGEVHESPVFKGSSLLLNTALLHLTHRSTTDGLQKTIKWTQIEAKLLAKSKIEKVSFFTILRKGLMEFVRKAILKKGYQDGLEGLIEALVQAINRALVYIQVWEFQRRPTLKDTYERLDLKIRNLWKKEKLT